MMDRWWMMDIMVDNGRDLGVEQGKEKGKRKKRKERSKEKRKKSSKKKRQTVPVGPAARTLRRSSYAIGKLYFFIFLEGLRELLLLYYVRAYAFLLNLADAAVACEGYGM